MNKLVSRIGRAIAVAVATAIPITLVGAPAAHAADHFTVDRDGVTVGRSRISSYKAFSGSMESWHDGANTRATLTGTFSGRGHLTVTFTFHDGLVQTGSTYDADATPKNFFATSGLGRSVVRFTVHYDADGDADCPTGTVQNVDYPSDHSVGECELGTSDHYWTGYVGDSPESLGNCNQLDTDPINIDQSGYAKLSGRVTYECTSTGKILALVRGNLYWTPQTCCGTANVETQFTYADGSVETRDNQSGVAYNGAQQSSVSLDTRPSKSIRSMQIWVTCNGTAGPWMASKFGDA